MVNLLDCTLRDGGYYNNWNFSSEMINDYLKSMSGLRIKYVELGFRSLRNEGFKGACAFTTDGFIDSLVLPSEIKLGVMINATELLNYDQGVNAALYKLMGPSEKSPISFVRIACHVREFKEALLAAEWLHNNGYMAVFNIMQIASCNTDEIIELSHAASEYPLDILYFADSLGGLTSDRIIEIVSAFRVGWSGTLGIHTHDNMGRAIENSMTAIEAGVTWVDGTITGMGRGPGNAQTEYLVIKLEELLDTGYDIIPTLDIIKRYFKPLQDKYKWGH